MNALHLKTRWKELYCLHNNNVTILFCKMVYFVKKYLIIAVFVAYFCYIKQRGEVLVFFIVIELSTNY